MADLEQNQQPDNSPDTGPDQMQRPAQYPTATKIDNGIAYDISGKQLGPVSGMEAQDADKNDDFFAKLGGKPVQAQQETKNDDFFAKLGGTPVQGSAQSSTPSAAAGQATGIGPRQSTVEHVSGGKDMLGREIEASPSAARHQWADWFQDLKSDLDNGTDATWVGWMLRKAGAKGLAYGNSPEIGHLIGGPVYGPAMVGHGLTIAQDRPAEGINEVISGVGTTLGPLAATQPEALPFMAIAGSTSKGVSYAAQQMGADPETAELIGNVSGLAWGMKMVGKSHLVDKFESSTNTYMDAQKNYVGRLREFENASRQATAAEQEAVVSRQLESQGQLNRQIRIEMEEKASAARSNASKSQKALQQVSELRDQAGVQMRQIARQIQGTRTLQKMDARRTKELAGAHEDFKSMAPPTRSGQAAYTDADLSVARGYLENSHSTKPLATVEDHFQALDAAQKSIDTKIDPYIKKYAAEPITTNIKMEVADKLAAQDKTTPGFLQKGLNALTEEHDLTDLSVKEADDLRETLNASNREIMSRHFPGSIELGSKLKTDPEFAANYYAMEAIREGIDGTLQDHNVDGIRDLRRDQASLIRVREAVERQLQRGDQKVRGSGQSGLVRQAAAETARKGAVAYGASKAGPLGAIAGDYLGERMGRMFSPGDLTRDQLAERTMRVKGAGRPVNQMTGGEGTQAVRPAFEIPPAPSTAMSPEDIQKIQRELSPLHGELATHYGEHVGDVSYEDLERQFMGDITDKQQHGVSLEPAEKTLLGKINQQNAADSLAAKQAAQEAALKGNQVGQATLPENAEPALYIEGAPNGMNTREVLEHELAHAVVGNEKGLPATEVRSHNHPTNDNRGRYASVAVDWSEFEKKEGGLDLNKVRDRMPDLAATFVAGGVANDLWHNIPFTENEGLGSDISALRDFMHEAGFTKAEAARMIAQAADDAAQVLQRPGVRDVIEQHAEVREPDLSNRLHFSEDRLQQVYQDIKGGANDATTGKSARTAREGNEGTSGTGAGREGKVQAGASEELREKSKGSTERKAEGTRGPDESSTSGTAGSSGTTKPEHPAVSAVAQGGHAGTEVASVEELARPGRFVKISRSGMPTDQGKTPDFNLAAGEAGYQVKPDGTYELKSGQETPVTKRGVESYAKQVFPRDLAVSSPAKDIVEKEGLKYKGELVPGSNVHMFEHPEHPGKTAALEGPLTPESVRTKMDSKLKEFGVSPKAKPLGEHELRNAADEFNKQHGRPPINTKPVAEDPRSSAVADAYKAAVHSPNDPAVKASYDALKRDVDEQFELAKKLGINMDVKDENPYGLGKETPAHEELHNDVRNNKHLSVWSGGAPPADHPLSAVDPKTGLTYNDKFRMVHDIFGHAAERQDFSPAGEETAWNLHRQMFSPEARPALATETKGQAAYTYKYGDFPPQKAALLPAEHQVRPEEVWAHKVAGNIENAPAGGINPSNPEAPSKRYGFEILPEARQALENKPTAEDFLKYADQHGKEIGSHPDIKLGWDTTGPKPELNIGAATDDLDKAKTMAGKLDQRALWDNKEEKTIDTGGKGEKTAFPEYPLEQRLKDLGKPEDLAMGVEKNAVKKKAYQQFIKEATRKGLAPVLGDLWENWDKAVPFTAHKDGFINIGDTHEAAFAEHHFGGADKIPENYSGYEDLASQWGDDEHARGWAAKDGSRMFLWDNLDDILNEKPDNKWPALKNALSKLQDKNIVNPSTKLWDSGGNNYVGSLGDLALLKDKAPSPTGSSVPLMENPLKIKGTGETGEITTTDVGKALAEYTGQKLSSLTQEESRPADMVNRAKRLMEDEARYQLNQNSVAQKWYTDDIAKHDQILREMRPELTDPAKLSMFKMVQSILSAGYNPEDNFNAALIAWDHYNETGEFPHKNPNTKDSWGRYGVKAYGDAIQRVNDLIQEKGEAGASEWLLADHPVSELKQRNPWVSGKTDETAPGTMIFGPKRGPFALNLHGREAAFTADQWVDRSWNRWMGTAKLDPQTGQLEDRVGKVERRLMQESFEHTAKKLDMSTSSLQAVLWYYEQALYDRHGVPTKPKSFSEAAKSARDREFSTFNFEGNK